MELRGTRQRVGNRAIFAGSLFVALLSLLLTAPLSVHAATGINEQLNYQARLLDDTGAVVPDGAYNMEFKIYQDGDGDLGGGDETLKWTETRTGADKVIVKNGYFSVQLGSVNDFSTDVNWNQSVLWLSTNIGGTGSPAWDGEMDPFRRLAAASYALNANQLGGLTASQFLQIAPSSVQVDATTNTSLFLNKTNGSGNILQLQKSGVDVISINNSGQTTFSSDVDLTLAATENLSVTSDLAGTVNLLSVVGTPSGTSGTTRGFFVQQADHASNTNGLDAALYIDNADTDLAIPAAISIQNSGGGGTPYTNVFDILGTGLSATELTVLDAGLSESEITGEIEAVTAGAGLTGGGTADSVTVTVGAGDGITVNADDVAVRLDTTAADGSSTSSVSGLEFVGGELSLIRGCGANQVLQWDNTNFEWDCATVSGGSGYATIQDETTPLTQRATVNFTGSGVSCVDNAGATRTDCTISGGGSSDLQQAYDTGAAGNQIITLDGTQDSIVITNPSSSGSDSGFAFQINQNNTTAGVLVADLVQASNAANAMNVTANAIDTETALAVTANTLTSGKVLSVASSSTAFTGALAEITLSGSDAANTGSLLKLSNTGVNSASTGLFIDHRATGTGNYALRIDDVASDNTPFIVDGDGRVGIGTTGLIGSTERLLQVGSPTNRGNVSVYGDIVSQGISDVTGLANIRDVYFYDTTADSDAGRWVDWATTDQLSWYQEALDDGPSDPCVIATDDRCYTKAFPRKAILIVTTDALYIFDAATNDMWMKFSQNSAGWALGVDTNNNPSSVSAANGVVYVGANGTASGGLYAIDFVNDRMWNYNATHRAAADVGINGRNTAVTYGTDVDAKLQLDPVGTSAEWMNVNDVAATVMNRSLSAVTALGSATNTNPGYGKVYVGLATDSGMTVINMTDRVLNQYSDVTADDYTSVAITSKGFLYGLNTTQDQLERWDTIDTDKASEVNGTFTRKWDETIATGPALASSAFNIIAGAPDNLEVAERASANLNTEDIIYVGHSLGMAELHDHTTQNLGWVKYFNATRETPFMPLAGINDMVLPMDDTSGTQAQDLAIANTDMAIKGTPTLGVDGVQGKAINFDNTDDYLCSDANQDNTCDVDTAFNMSTVGWTISLWFRHSATAPASGADTIFEKCVTATPGKGVGCVIAYMTTTGTIVVANDVDGTYTRPDEGAASYNITATSTYAYNDNQWHNLVITRTNANDVDSWIDSQGMNLSTATGGTTTFDGSQIVSIGASCVLTVTANCGAVTNVWDGQIDDVQYIVGTTTQATMTQQYVRRLYSYERPRVSKRTVSVTDATSATSTSITDTGEAWFANEFAGSFVEITGGTGAGQTRRISGNTPTTLTVTPAFSTTPDTTSDFEVDPEALSGSTSSVMGIGVTTETPLGEARQMCIGTNDSSDGGAVTCYNHQDGPGIIADIFHGDTEQSDDFGVEWTGTDYDDIRSIDLSGRALIAASEAHFYAETRDVRLGQGLDYLANQLYTIRQEIVLDGITAVGSIGAEVGFTGGADLAERYTSSEPLLPGEVVTLEANNVGAVKKSSAPYQQDMIGIVATEPGLLLGPETENSYPVALVGRVPVRVTTENGPIKAGDRLTSSSTPGYAMKATHAGRTLGTVLDDLTEDTSGECPTPQGVGCGVVNVFVNLVDFNGSIDLAINDAESSGLLSSETILDPNGGLISGDLNDEQRAAKVAQLSQADKILRYLSGRQSQTEDSSEVLADRVSAVDIHGANIFAKNLVTLDFSAGGLTIDGTARFNGQAFFAGHISSGGTAPTMEFPATTTTGTIEGNDTAGQLNVTFTQNTTTGTQFTVKFNKAYGKAPRVFLSPANNDAAQLRYFVTSTADGFSVVTSDPPPDGTASFGYWIVE